METTNEREGSAVAVRVAAHARGDRAPLHLWAAVAAMSVVVRVFADRPPKQLDRWGSLVRWDGPGHVQSASDLNAAFASPLPVYPVTVRALTWVTGTTVATAVLVSYAGGAVATAMLWRWLELRGHDRRERLVATTLFLLFPGSYVLYGIAGPEALGAALALGALVLGEQRRFVLAGVVGALAVATHLGALALVPALALLAVHDGSDSTASSPSRRRLGQVLMIGAVPLAGIAAVLARAWMLGNLGLVWRELSLGSGLGWFHPLSWIRIGFLLQSRDPWEWMVVRGVQTVMVYASIAAAWCVKRRYGNAYWSAVLVTVSVAIVTTGEASVFGRRLLLAFPILGVAAAVLGARRRWVTVAVLVISGLAMLTVYGAYVRGVGAPYW